MKKIDVTQPYAMTSPFADGVYSSVSTSDFEIPAETSTAPDDTCVIDDGFLPITSIDLDDGGIAPERKNFNGMFYLSTDQRFYLQNGGFITYNSNVATAIGGYPQDAVLGFIDGQGTYKLVRSLIDDNTNDFTQDETLIDGEHWEEIAMGGGSSRNIGEIVASTIPLTDAGLHLLDGALIDGNGIYSDFVDYISNLDLTANYFTDEATWQQSITDYGVCGKFVYDSVNNTVRLPKITGIVEGTTDLTALGDLVEAGLPNITASPTGIWRRNGNMSTIAEGATTIVQDTTHDYIAGSGSTPESVWVASFDASLSNSIYGNSTTVQPQAIRVLYYVVIATTTKTQIQVDIDQIATDLNGKVDKADLQEVQCVVETYSNGTSWYRIYSDGWCEQGGWKSSFSAANTFEKVTLLKTYKNTNYNIQVTGGGSATTIYNYKVGNSSTNEVDGFKLLASNAGAACWWRTAGYLAQGQY